MWKILHRWHDEKKAKWTFIRLEETEGAYHAVWEVTCNCGVVRERKRAYVKPINGLSPSFYEHYSLENVGKLHYLMCGHTEESAREAAKGYKGDNYHI